MFEDSLLESAHLIRRQSRWPAFFSVALQVAVAAVIVVVPLLRPAALTLNAASLVLTAPEMPKTKPPVVQPTHVAQAMTSARPAYDPLQPPRIVPGSIDREYKGEPVAVGIATGETMSASSPFDPSLMASNTVPPRVKEATPVRPTRISALSTGVLLEPIKPVYPAIAKATGQQGTVVIHAIISKEGKIESANVVSGPSLLQGAALEAVKAAHYRPYLLNGEPTEVETTFSINFHMTS
jgi:protein TonB